MGPRGTKGSKLLRFSKELLKSAPKTTATLRMQTASITRLWSPVYLKRCRNNGGRRENELGQTMCDRECLIQLQQVLRRPVQNVPVPLSPRPQMTSPRTPTEGGFDIPEELVPSGQGGFSGPAGSEDIKK